MVDARFRVSDFAFRVLPLTAQLGRRREFQESCGSAQELARPLEGCAGRVLRNGPHELVVATIPLVEGLTEVLMKLRIEAPGLGKVSPERGDNRAVPRIGAPFAQVQCLRASEHRVIGPRNAGPEVPLPEQHLRCGQSLSSHAKKGLDLGGHTSTPSLRTFKRSGVFHRRNSDSL